MPWSRVGPWHWFQAMMGELGEKLGIELKCDTSAAVGMVMRKGLGKVRHIGVTQLWLQEKQLQVK